MRSFNKSILVFLMAVLWTVHVSSQNNTYTISEREEKAKQGSVFSMASLAYQYHKGINVEKDIQKACYWYQKAVDNGHVICMHNLATIYQTGEDGVPVDYNKAETLYKMAADKGYAWSFYGLGNIAFLKNDYYKSLEYNKKAADLGIYDAMYCVSSLYMPGGGLPMNIAEGLKWLKKAENSTIWRVKHNLGWIYSLGLGGTEKNIYTSLSYFRDAWFLGHDQLTVKQLRELYEKEWININVDAEKGNVDAMFFIGYAYMLGAYVERNYKVAMDWFEKADAKGSDKADFEIAFMYFWGYGVDKNLATARKYLEKSSLKGNREAMLELGIMYLKGEGGPVDKVKSAYWYQKSAEAGNIRAMNGVGYNYISGEGVERDFSTALYWFGMGAKNWDSESRQNYTRAKYTFARQLYENKEYEKALPLLLEAANDMQFPNAQAMRLLAAFYRYGLAGMPVDTKLEKNWFDRAVDAEDEKAMMSIVK